VSLNQSEIVLTQVLTMVLLCYKRYPIIEVYEMDTDG
jgi:hypothetical protein